MKQLLALDTTLSQKLTLPPGSDWWPLARLMAHVGDGPNIFGLLLLVALFSWLWQDIPLLWANTATALIVFITLLVATAIKFFVRRRRPRPPGEFVVFRYDAYSFPSGHSARMAALSMSAIFFYPLIGLFLLLITLGVAIARIAVGVHYLSDVLVGLGLGFSLAWVSLALAWPIS